MKPRTVLVSFEAVSDVPVRVLREARRVTFYDGSGRKLDAVVIGDGSRPARPHVDVVRGTKRGTPVKGVR